MDSDMSLWLKKHLVSDIIIPNQQRAIYMITIVSKIKNSNQVSKPHHSLQIVS